MNLSRFVYRYDLDGTVCLFHSLLLKKLYMSREEWERVEHSLSDKTRSFEGVPADLYRLGFIVEADEDRRLRALAIERLAEPKKIHTMFLVVTEDCNFRCRCCYESNARKDMHEHMSFEIAKKAIDTFGRITQHDLPRTILFYGGEPLIEYPLVKKSLDYIYEMEEHKKIKSPCFKSITTNGSLLSEKIVKELKNYENLSIGLSLDGMEKHQNSNRVYPNGHGTYKDVAHAVRLLEKHDMEFAVICTVGRHNVAELDSIAKHFVLDMGIKNVAFNLLIGREDGSNPLEVSGDIAARGITKAYEFLRSQDCYEGRMSRQIIPFVEEKLYFFDCDASGQQVVVTPDGMVGPCVGFISSRRGFLSDKLDTFDIYQGENELFLKASPIVMEDCQECPCIGICGGGCHYNRLVKTGDSYKPEKGFCNYAHGVLEWMIKRLEPAKI